MEIGIEVYKGNGNKPQPEPLKKLDDLKKAITASPLVGDKLIEFIRKAKTNLDEKYSHAVDYKECVAWLNGKIKELEGDGNGK